MFVSQDVRLQMYLCSNMNVTLTENKVEPLLSLFTGVRIPYPEFKIIMPIICDMTVPLHKMESSLKWAGFNRI